MGGRQVHDDTEEGSPRLGDRRREGSDRHRLADPCAATLARATLAPRSRGALSVVAIAQAGPVDGSPEEVGVPGEQVADVFGVYREALATRGPGDPPVGSG
jgi:hypothetical protein